MYEMNRLKFDTTNSDNLIIIFFNSGSYTPKDIFAPQEFNTIPSFQDRVTLLISLQIF